MRVTWTPTDFSIDIADGFRSPVSMRITFSVVHAFQGIDEGFRLADIPVGDALVYSTPNSRYLTAFRENAATAMDSTLLIHWIVVSGNQCVNVLSETSPAILILPLAL